MTSDAASLRDLLEPSVEALGYELVHLEFTARGRDNLLRAYIDAPGGIRVDDCEAVSQRLSAVLDVEDPLQCAYQLEVSSPGLDRPLVTPAHFRRFAGRRARIVLRAGAHGHSRRRFCGELIEADERRAVIEVDGERYELAYADMQSARLEPTF
ncbi:MAG: ribosome maturation factor RimP [bacterium]